MKIKSFVKSAARPLGVLGGMVFCAVLLGLGITEEVPISTIKGRVFMRENGRPLPGAVVSFVPVDHGPERPRVRVATVKEDGTFSVPNIQAGAYYSLEVSARAHVLSVQQVYVDESGPLVLDLQLEPKPYYLDLYAAQKVFLPGEKVTFEIHGFSDSETVAIRAFRLNPDRIIEAGGLQRVLWPLARRDRTIEPETVGTKVFTLEAPVSARDAEGVFIERPELKALEEGFYWIDCSSSTAKAGTYVLVSRIAAVTKNGGAETLCYVTDLATGRPVQGVSLETAENGGVRVEGRTDASGLARIQKDAGLLIARHGASIALVGEFGEDDAVETGPVRFAVYAERPVYRPGDLIHFKAIARKLAGNGYSLPGSGVIQVDLLDPQGSKIDTLQAEVNDKGAISASFRTSPEAAPGAYQLSLRGFDSTHQHYVILAAYRKPEFTIEVKPEKESVVAGQRARVIVDCNYYFGAPVAGAKLNVSVYRNPDWSAMWGEWHGEDNEDFDAEGMEDSWSPDVRYGEYTREIKATTDARGRAVIEFDTRAPRDPSRYEVDFIYSVVVDARDEGDKYFSGSGSVKVTRGNYRLTAKTDRYFAKPNEAVKLSIKTLGIGDQASPVPNRPVTVRIGTNHWRTGVVHFAPLETIKVTTDANGEATVPMKVGIGDALVAKLTTVDDDGNTISVSSYVYVSNHSWSERQAKQLELVLDKDRYDVGEKANLLLRTGKPGGVALVCVQTDRVLSTHLVDLATGSATLVLPVDPSFAPNVYVSAVYVKDKTFSEATRPLQVEQPARKIEVSVTSERADYEPGQTANLRVRTTDSDGKPVSADVSLAVVDESIYAIRKDSTNLLRAFYPRRYNQVRTTHSFPEVYLDGGDKGGSANIPVRSRFEDTAFWAASVQTDDSGLATVDVALPDNLTSWRATAIGVTDDTAVGMAKTNFRARKPLMVRVQPPQFMVQSDSQAVAVTVTNDTGKDASVRLTVEAENVKLQEQVNRTLRVRAGQSSSIDVVVDAATSGKASLTAKAWIEGGASDGVSQTFAVQPHGRLVTSHLSGDFRDAKDMRLALRPNADRTHGSLQIRITPSIASAMFQSLDSLVRFPYGCVEQTMSRFMPSILVMNAINDLGLGRPDLAKRIPKIAADGFARLAKMQHPDGGWGWWEYDESDPYMTAYVLDGLLRASEAGFPSVGIDVGRALDWATKHVAKGPTGAEGRLAQAYSTYVLARYGRKEAAAAALEAFRPEEASASELSMAIRAMHLSGTRPDRIQQALDKLKAQAVDGSRWHEEWWSWGMEPTALALLALVEVRPADPMIPAVIRTLLRARTGDYWGSTRETSHILIALTTILNGTKEATAPGSVTVKLNGETLETYDIKPSLMTDPELVLSVPIGRLEPGDNIVRLESNREAPVYYSITLRQYDVAPRIGTLITGSGLNISRSYHLMEVRKDAHGYSRLMPSSSPVTKVKTGDVLACRLIITSDKDRAFIMVEDPIPSNCRVTEREDVGSSYEWYGWWARTEIRDDKVSFFATRLGPGQHMLTYTMRAESPGIAHALPTTIENMYHSAQFGSSAEDRLEVLP